MQEEGSISRNQAPLRSAISSKGLTPSIDMMLQQVATLVETLNHLGALLIYLLSPTLQPPPPLINVVRKTKKC